jgi:hypothetical protein
MSDKWKEWSPALVLSTREVVSLGEWKGQEDNTGQERQGQTAHSNDYTFTQETVSGVFLPDVVWRRRVFKTDQKLLPAVHEDA